MTNPDNVGGLPELPEPAAILERTWRGSYFVGKTRSLEPVDITDEHPVYTADQMRAYGELCRAAPAGGDVECFVREMRTSKGSEFFVVVKRDGRELTPHMYTERWKAEYDVASWQHLLCGAPEPDLLAYGPSEDSAPDGSRKVERMDVVYSFLMGVSDLDGVSFGELHPDKRGRFWWRHELAAAYALLRKLQQGADERLLDALKRADALAVCCTAVDSYSRNELWDIAEAFRAHIRPLIASQGQEGGTNG